MPLGLSARVSTSLAETPAACMVDGVSEETHLRGHVTLQLSPVPQTGGQLLALLDCACVGGGVADDTITTSTGFTNGTEVCIVRLQVMRRSVPADVNEDGFVNAADVSAIRASGSSFDTGEACGTLCGRADVNRDGFVNETDVDTVLASVPLGTNVACGAVYLTHISCGADRRAPPDPVVAISLDQVRFASSDGVLLGKKKKRHARVTADVAREMFAHTLLLNEKNLADRSSLEQLTHRVHELLEADILERNQLSQGLVTEKRNADISEERLITGDAIVAIMAVFVASCVVVAVSWQQMRRRIEM